VAAINTQMGHDSAGPCSLTHSRCDERLRLRVFGFRHRGIPRLPQRCYVIDVNAEAQTAHLIRKISRINRGKIGLTQSA
jgi:hypothetical protein